MSDNLILLTVFLVPLFILFITIVVISERNMSGFNALPIVLVVFLVMLFILFITLLVIIGAYGLVNIGLSIIALVIVFVVFFVIRYL